MVITQHKVLGKGVFFSGVLEGRLNDHVMKWDILKLRINRTLFQGEAGRKLVLVSQQTDENSLTCPPRNP